MGDSSVQPKKANSRAKINKMMTEGAKNFPAYLKLIYTGDSELSSDDEAHLIGGGGGQRQRSDGGDNEGCSPVWNVASPESEKLLDGGREKAKTPDTNNSDVKNVNVNGCAVKENNKVDRDEMEKELVQIQEEISSLRSVLNTKLNLANQLKRNLGLTPISEFRTSLRNLRQSETYQRTNAAIKSLGCFASKTFTSFRYPRKFFRNSEDLSIKQSVSLCNLPESQYSMIQSRSETNMHAYSNG